MLKDARYCNQGSREAKDHYFLTRGPNSSLTKTPPTHRISLVIATGNRGKFNEIAALLEGLKVRIVPLDRAGPVEVPPEGGDSFQENARVKAVTVARATGHLSLADDSGLEVDALGGAPGIFSARFGGTDLTDSDRCRLLLDKLIGVPPARRTARFRCVVAVAEPGGAVHLTSGTCEGRIATGPLGSHGFGYDPIFEVPALGRTLAEVGSDVKNRVSHRAQAIRAAREILERLLSSHKGTR
jgi:XTP/dITP diphosphohydrolase